MTPVISVAVVVDTNDTKLCRTVSQKQAHKCSGKEAAQCEKSNDTLSEWPCAIQYATLGLILVVVAVRIRLTDLSETANIA